MKGAAAAVILALAACTTATGPAGRFTGSVTPNTPGPLCVTTRAFLQITEGHVIFAPDDGTWVLEGSISADNTITADKSRIASNKQIYDTTFEGRLTADAITGTYKTPRCSSTVALARR